MKKSKEKSKAGRGGARAGAGGGCRWKHGRTKLVRLPIALLDEILEVARYMDRNEGYLPPSAPPVITSGHPSHALSSEELKELFAKQKVSKLVENIVYGDGYECVSDFTFKELPDFSITKLVDLDNSDDFDLDDFFEAQDQKRYDS